MSILDIDLKQSPSANVYIFTTYISPRLVTLLGDDYNFETCLRLLNDLNQNVKLQSTTNHEQKCKALVNMLFSRIGLNLVIYKLTALTSDLSSDLPFDPWKPLQFSFNEYGKPLLSVITSQGPMSLQFNSSSSNSILSIIVELSVQNTPIGIDLSHTKQTSISSSEFMDQFSPMFSQRERQQLLLIDCVDRYTLFNHLWTLKEAFTKFLGCGLNIELADFDFVFGSKTMDISHYAIRQMVSTKDGILRYSLNWYVDIDIDVSKLQAHKNPFLETIDSPGNIYCHSSVLFEGNILREEFPVIISFINQNPNPNIDIFDIDFVELLHLN